MKINNVVSYSFLFLLLLTSCVDDKPSEKKNKATEEIETENTTLMESQKTGIDEKRAASNLMGFEAIGYFDTNKDELFLTIPVPSEDFKILEVSSVSNVNNGDLINAVAVRVSDNLPTPAAGRPQFFIDTLVSINSLKLDAMELQKDNELIVLTYNSVDEFQDSELESFKKCISKSGDYLNPENCLEGIRKEGEPFLPNNRKGSVIKGL